MEEAGLLKVLIEATGLPTEAVERELTRIFTSKGIDPARLTMDDVREVLSIYLQDVLMEAKNTLSESTPQN